VARDRCVDQARVVAAQRFVIETEAGHHARPVIFNNNVGSPGQPLEHRARLVLVQIQDNALLAAVDGVEGGTVVAAGAGHAACRITGRWLDFNHTRAHVSQ
jgi:hypothetical protein